MALPLILAAAGTGLSIYAKLTEANAKAEAVRRESELRDQQANEILARQQINADIIQKQAGITADRHLSAAAAQGVSGIGGQLTMLQNAQEQIELTRRDAQFKSYMIRAGAQLEREQADSLQQAAIIGSVGSAFSLGANLYDIERGPTEGASLFGGSGGKVAGPGFWDGASPPKTGNRYSFF